MEAGNFFIIVAFALISMIYFIVGAFKGKIGKVSYWGAGLAINVLTAQMICADYNIANLWINLSISAVWLVGTILISLLMVLLLFAIIIWRIYVDHIGFIAYKKSIKRKIEWLIIQVGYLAKTDIRTAFL